MSAQSYEWGGPRVTAFLASHLHRIPRVSSWVPTGWDESVADALTALPGIERASGKAVDVRQIKEKFGQVRIYVAVDENSVGQLEVVRQTPASTHLCSSAAPGSVLEHAFAIVDQAAERAELYCITCGAPTTHRSGVYHVCAAHYQEPQP